MTSKEISDGADVVLEVDGVKFNCQRNQLASQSPYFEAMFSDNFIEKHRNVIKIQGVDAAAMRFLLRWINDSTQIDSLLGEEILVVLQAAAMLQFQHLQSTCEEVMVQRWLSPESCLLTAATADQLSLSKLHHKASALALWHFSEVRHTQAFLDLPLDALVQYLSDDALSLGSNEEEFQVFEAVSSWVEHKILERCGMAMQALSCVRMNFIPVSDIQSMLNYACVDSHKDAQLVLKCIINIREGRDIAIDDDKIVQVQEKIMEEEDNGCCETFKRIAGSIKACSSEVSVDADSVVMMNDEDIELKTRGTIERFSAESLAKAQSILRLTKRRLPTVACFIGHFKKRETELSDDDGLPAYGQAKRNKWKKERNGALYVFYWDSGKSKEPIPLLPLTKIDQGPSEALGYTVISRGQEIFVIGGEYLLGYGNWNNSVWKYNVWSETWTYETSLAVPRRHQSVVCLDDDMYVIGGCGKFRVLMDSVDRYNFNTKTWHKCAPMPSSQYSAATCVHKNLIYVISCQVFCYYPTSNSWATLSDVNIPAGSSFNTAMPDGDYIYLTGLYSSSLMCYDPHGEKSIKLVGSFQNPAGHACLVGRKIYSFTKSNEDEEPCVEMYDIDTNTFQILWEGSPSDSKISFKKLGGCFPLILYDTLWHTQKCQ